MADWKYLEEADAESCPWCGEQPVIEPWHGGGPRKRMVHCVSDFCRVQPRVCGSTRSQALALWNTRL